MNKTKIVNGRSKARRKSRAAKPYWEMNTAETISVTVEKRLLAQTDRLAKKLHLPRAALIARGLQAVVGEEVPIG